MSTRATTLAVGLALILGAVVPAALAASTGRQPHVTVTVAACHPGVSPADRYVAFSAGMTALPTSRVMGVRFDLVGHTPGSSGFRHLPAPGLGVWYRSQPGIQLFSYRQEVTNLPQSGGFRAFVSYRWYDAAGKILRRARRRSATCAIPDLRPHLAVGSITRRAGLQRGTTFYDVVVRNDGLGPAPAFAVALAIDGAAQPTQALTGLAAGQRQTVTFLGPRCNSGASVTATIDPASKVSETTRADNARTVDC